MTSDSNAIELLLTRFKDPVCSLSGAIQELLSCPLVFVKAKRKSSQIGRKAPLERFKRKVLNLHAIDYLYILLFYFILALDGVLGEGYYSIKSHVYGGKDTSVWRHLLTSVFP